MQNTESVVRVGNKAHKARVVLPPIDPDEAPTEENTCPVEDLAWLDGPTCPRIDIRYMNEV